MVGVNLCNFPLHWLCFITQTKRSIILYNVYFNWSYSF